MSAQYIPSQMSGGGESDYFYVYRSLVDDLHQSTSNIEELFQQVFQEASNFQGQISLQNGKAASTFKKNVNEHIEFIAKGAPILLNFADIIKHLIVAIELTDDGDGTMDLSVPTDRMEWQYSLSTEKHDLDIDMNTDNITQAAIQFKMNLMNIDKVFSEYKTMLEKVINDSYLPWGGLTGIWAESSDKVQSLTNKIEKQTEKLIKDADQFVTEMTRLDIMAGDLMIQI